MRLQDSILNGLNPVLDAQRPAFISALSISRIELGDKPPQISGVKFVAANALTDEVTIDIAVRVVTDESFAGELKLVSNLGAAASMSLRDLFLVGTLRLTLNPLIGEWPCFRWAVARAAAADRQAAALTSLHALWCCRAQRTHPVLHVVRRAGALL
jgi:hypothetical protein